MNNNYGLTLIPPVKISKNICLNIKVGICNSSNSVNEYFVDIFWDSIDSSNKILSTTIPVSSVGSESISVEVPVANMFGKHKIIVQITNNGTASVLAEDIFVVDSSSRSPKTIDGAWVGITHWSEAEGKLWNDDIRKMSDNDWRELIRSMHDVGMDIIVIQELFRNEKYVGEHDIESKGYHGKAYYDSLLFSDKMNVTAEDPVEAIFSEADALGMKVFPGIGLYAWFDFTEGSLEWHKKIAGEVWNKYGHHKSLYGWYISEEIHGHLGENNIRRQELVSFFDGFRKYIDTITPDKPIMLATNSFGVDKDEGFYPEFCENLDILCPFGWTRMPQGDMSASEAFVWLKNVCDKHNTHLWMDMEIFNVEENNLLSGKSINEIANELMEFSDFEKVLCYQFPGFMCSPEMSITPGGEKAVELYVAYKNSIA